MLSQKTKKARLQATLFVPSLRKHHPTLTQRNRAPAKMAKPTILLVPGAWHTPAIYSSVITLLSPSYECIPLTLPSVGASPPHQNFDLDVLAIHTALLSLLESGKDIVLVVHSYAGLPGQEACKGLSKKEREGRGEKGGVLRYVVINGLVLPEGFESVAMGDYGKFPGWMNVDPEVNAHPSQLLVFLNLKVKRG